MINIYIRAINFRIGHFLLKNITSGGLTHFGKIPSGRFILKGTDEKSFFAS